MCNSDSETDSSDGLEDLGWLLHKSPPRLAQKRATDFPQYASQTRQTRSGIIRQQRRKGPVVPPAKSYKFSLSSLVDASIKDVKAEKRIAESRLKLEAPVEKSTRAEDVGVNETVLDSLVQDEDDGNRGERLLLAMKRTNALHQEPTYHFFRDDIQNPPRKPFPTSSIPRHKWAAIFKDPKKRDQAFISGYARHTFRHRQLPEELAWWMLDEMIFHPREEVNDEYLQIFKVSEQMMSGFFTPEMLCDMFRRLGGKDEITNPESLLNPSYEAPNIPKRRIPAGLRWLIFLIGQAAAALPLKSLIVSLNILIRLSFDDSVLADGTLQNAIEHSIEALIESITDCDLDRSLRQISSNLVAAVQIPIFQDRLVTSMPCTTPLAHQFQRYVALSFFLSPTPLTEPLTSAALPSIIHTHLSTSPNFQVTPETSYHDLGARISLLDRAIGPGFSALTFLPNKISSPNASLVPTPNPGTLQSKEEKAFNESVDMLASSVKWVSNRIIDGRATDMSRCEAKSVCERLYYRLDSAVRTRARRQRGVFGGDGGEGEQRVLGKWFKRDVAEG